MTIYPELTPEEALEHLRNLRGRIHATTLAERIKCVERELNYRTRLYPRWVANGKLGKVEADYELECMQAVLHTLRHLEGPEPEQAELIDAESKLPAQRAHAQEETP